MVRRHGWQLPAHTYQVVAITVFFLLSTAFYVFLAPFLGNTDLEYAAIGVYSFVALAVFLLYVRCTAIDPADPGILASSWKFVSKEEKGPLAESFNSGLPGHSLAASASGRSSSLAHFDKNPIQFSDEVLEKPNHHSFCYVLLGCLLGWFVKSDNCKPDRSDQQAGNDEDVLFCTLCNVEVRKYSKHCRSCDKCVDGFDHHCRWLNNCVGRKNYITFVSLMATCLIMLILDWGIGLAVLVRCFVNKKGIEAQIVEKLGNGFSRPPFIVVTVICTIVPLLASIPLGELFFFHIILIRKGITTYEYVVAMRAQNEPQGIPEIEQQSIPSSPTSSTATGLSGSSSVGLQYRGAWCTPPRVFVDHQEDEVVPHLGPGRVPSTVDPDATASGSRGDPRANKRAVRISAWRLAKLDRTEAVRAASKARESSSVLRPVGSREVGASETGYSSSSNASVRSSVSADYGLAWGSRIRQDFVSPRTAYPPSQATSKDDAETGGISASSLSSPGVTTGNTSTALSPLPLEMRFGNTAMSGSRAAAHNQPRRMLPAMGTGTRHSLPIYHGTTLSPLPVGNPTWIGTTPASDGGEVSSGTESVDDRRRSNSITADVDSRPLSNFGGSIRDNRSTVYWDRTAGRFISVPNRNHLMRISNPFSRQQQQPVMPNNNIHPPFASSAVEAENNQSHCSPDNISRAQRGSPEPSSLVSPENLTYTGTSIFFGGPLSVPLSGNARKNTPSSNPPPDVGPTNPPLAGNGIQQNATMRAPAARPQSPIFVPQRAQQNSSLPR